ncbi:MAG: zeta toxin family protein [Faecalimonas sp.]|nr:zeta toxin family protein [Faecalimonas sp.]
MKKYILIAGVNGAGKSTLYHSLQELQDMPRVNTDEILKQFGGKWNDSKDVIKAGKIAVEKISECFQKGISFNQETTLCGKSIIQNIKRAKEAGFSVEIHYVGVDSVELAKERVHHRVLQGGHGIPDADIIRRYVESFENLSKIADAVDELTFYDNTEYFEMVAVYHKGIPIFKKDDMPRWFDNVNIR